MPKTTPVLVSLSLLVLAGCGASMSAGGFGVTPGGAQDMGHARALIEAGQIPSSADYTVEGLFSEHDLPLDGAPCAFARVAQFV